MMQSASKYLDLSMLTVLVVDDNRHMRDIVTQILRSLGVRRVIVAEDGLAAFDKLRATAVDIVIVDHMMTPITGTEFTHLVRNREDSPNPFVPILMMTGYADKDTIIGARNAGVHDIVVKPVSAARISGRLADLILRPRNFIRTKTFFGPDRRDGRGLDTGDRRRSGEDAGEAQSSEQDADAPAR